MREEQQAKILQAAGRVFARKGAAATMDEVAAEAGVSHGLAYRYFPGKEALFGALVAQALQNTPLLFHRVLEMPGTAGERLRRVVAGLVESRRRPEPYQLLDRVLSDESAPSELRELVRRRGRELHDVLRQLIVEGQAMREVAAGDPDGLVAALLACIEGLTTWAERYGENDGEHYPDAEIFLRMLRP